MKTQEYNIWKHHPVTKMFMQFLNDQRDAQLKYLLAAWEDGALTLMDEKEIRGRTALMKELTELEYSAIQAFYGVEPDAAEVDTDGTSEVHSG